jgi:hypothetical protein
MLDFYQKERAAFAELSRKVSSNDPKVLREVSVPEYVRACARDNANKEIVDVLGFIQTGIPPA